MKGLDQAKFEIMCRTLDGWFLMDDAATVEAVSAWLASVEGCDCADHRTDIDVILEAEEIS